MNSVILTGYIATEPEIRSTTQGTSVCTCSLAVRRPKTKDDTTDFLNVVCWRSTAEFVGKYFKKGSGIEVIGVLTTRKWKDKDGNNRYAVEVVADEVDFGKKSKTDEETGRRATPYSGSANRAANRASENVVIPDDFEEILGDCDMF